MSSRRLRARGSGIRAATLPARVAPDPGSPRAHRTGMTATMKITRIREATAPIASEIRNAFISFSTMTISLVAVETDVVREGKPVIGYGFSSNGRYAQGGILRERFIPRIMAADPKSLVDRQRRQPRSRSPSGRPSWPTRSPAATATVRTPPARSTWRSGMRWPRSPASRSGACCPSASTAAVRRQRCSSIRAAATTTRARSSRACRPRCAATRSRATRSSR